MKRHRGIKVCGLFKEAKLPSTMWGTYDMNGEMLFIEAKKLT